MVLRRLPFVSCAIRIDRKDDKYVIILTNSDNGLQFSKEAAKDFLQIDGSWDIPR